MDYTPQDYKRLVQLLNIGTNQPGWQRRDSGRFFCPLGHSKKHSPSLDINFLKGVFICRSCHQGGHLSYLVELMNAGTINALLGLRADMVVLTQDPYANVPKETVKIERVPEVDLRGVLVPWNLSPEATAYLDYRGILPLVATRANIKFLDHGYANGTTLWNRLMIPVYDEERRAINWECRDVTFKARVKCLYPRHTITTLYEWYVLNKKKPLYLFEGLIKLLVARSDPYFANSTTTFGSGISPLQLEQLNQFEHLIVVPDKDPPADPITGKKKSTSAEDAIQFLRENWKGKNLQILDLNHPIIKDVDEIPTKLDMTVRDFRMSGGFVMRGTLENSVLH